MAITSPAGAPPADASVGGAREAVQHLAAVAASFLLPLALGATHHLTTSQWEQVAIGGAGFGLTYAIREAPRGWRRGIKKVIPMVTGVATALVPLATHDGSLAALTGVAGAVPVLHVLAGLTNIVRPNVKAGTPTTAAAVVPAVSTAPSTTAADLAAEVARQAEQAYNPTPPPPPAAP